MSLPIQDNQMAIIDFSDIIDLRNEIFKSGLKPYILINLTGQSIKLYANCIERMIQIAQECDSSITYAYYRELQSDGTRRDHPLNDYQFGSVRDNFEFGPLILLNTADVLLATEKYETSAFSPEANPDGGWYALRLELGARRPVCLIQEYLYEIHRTDYRNSGQRQHDYQAVSQREYQKCMENILKEHLMLLGVYLDPERMKKADIDKGEFPAEASVIIPVRNRVKTIADAVRSALSQTTDFEYNVIVIDNASTDGTTEILDSVADPRLKIIKVYEDEGLGIGGCWNKGIQSELCGRYAVQLDSDDVYSNEFTLQRIINCFRENSCAMIIGSYTLTDGEMNPLEGKPVIDHKEWSDENGANNALRINGFGAPRAYLTRIARKFLFPNVSYGEDYAMCLRITRSYKIGRIYDSIYNCRRWDGNSDAHLSIEKENAHNYYKDFIRTIEMMARVKENIEDADVSSEL